MLYTSVESKLRLDITVYTVRIFLMVTSNQIFIDDQHLTNSIHIDTKVTSNIHGCFQSTSNIDAQRLSDIQY